MSEITSSPSSVLLVSGKRKCGKDYLTDKLLEKIGEDLCSIIKISGPIKLHWSKEKDLSFEELLSSNETKEMCRKDMIVWSEAVRAKDPGYFCRAALQMYKAYEKPVWIVSDIRRKSDIKWFKENYGEAIVTLRISAGDDVRNQRGWIFTEGIDDAETECNLDDYLLWDKIICNDGSVEPLLIVDSIIALLKNHNEATANYLSAIL